MVRGKDQTPEEEAEDRRKVLELMTPEHLKKIEDTYAEQAAQSEEPHKLLHDPDFIGKVQKELDKKIEGEHQARHTIFLVMNMRNVKNLSKASDNLMVNDMAGIGKDHIVSAIFELIPDHEKVKRERISPKVLVYLNDTKTNPEGWTKKLLYLEDVPNVVLNDDSFKVMSSANPNGTTETSVISNQTIKHVSIRGKPTIVLTIAVANPKDELLRRYPIQNLTGTIDQTKAILKKQAQFAQTGISQEYNPAIKKALAKLSRVPVKIPYADLINSAFPVESVIVRTHFPRFLDYIKSSCSLHQFQRKIDDQGYFLAEEQDYELARQVLAATTSNQLMIPLTKMQRQVLEFLASVEKKPYTIEELSELMQGLGGDSYIRKSLEKLSHNGFVKKSHGQQEGKGRPPVLYTYNELVKLELPSFKDLIKNNPNRETKENNPSNPNSPTIHLLDKMDKLDLIFNGQEKSAKLSNPLQAELNLVKNLIFNQKDGVTWDVLQTNWKVAGKDLDRLNKHIERLKEQGEVFEPTPGTLRRFE